MKTTNPPLETRLSLVGQAIDGLMESLVAQRARLDRVREALDALHGDGMRTSVKSDESMVK